MYRLSLSHWLVLRVRAEQARLCVPRDGGLYGGFIHECNIFMTHLHIILDVFCKAAGSLPFECGGVRVWAREAHTHHPTSVTPTPHHLHSLHPLNPP